MTFTAKHKASGRYGVINDKDEWIEGFLGTKEEAQAKAEELSKEVNHSSSLASDSVGNVDISSNDKPKQTEQEKTNEDNARAPAPLASKAKKDQKVSKGFTLTANGWLAN